MRPIVLGDLIAMAQCLRGLPVTEVGMRVRSMIRHAELADQWRLRTGRRHARWGCGSLYDVAAPDGCSLADSDFAEPTFLRALGEVCLALAEHPLHRISASEREDHAL